MEDQTSGRKTLCSKESEMTEPSILDEVSIAIPNPLDDRHCRSMSQAGIGDQKAHRRSRRPEWHALIVLKRA